MTITPVVLWLTTGFFHFWASPAPLSPMQTGAELASNPVLLYSVVLPGSPPEGAVRAIVILP